MDGITDGIVGKSLLQKCKNYQYYRNAVCAILMSSSCGGIFNFCLPEVSFHKFNFF